MGFLGDISLVKSVLNVWPSNCGTASPPKFRFLLSRYGSNFEEPKRCLSDNGAEKSLAVTAMMKGRQS
jgi:hypothetical protein